MRKPHIKTSKQGIIISAIKQDKMFSMNENLSQEIGSLNRKKLETIKKEPNGTLELKIQFLKLKKNPSVTYIGLTEK